MSTVRGGSTAIGLRVLSAILGTFLILMASNKVAWLTDSGFLTYELQQWLDIGPVEVSRWYLEHVAMPGAPVFARLVLLGELAAGVALVCGFRARLAAGGALVMVLNFHFASGIIFTSGYLTNGYGPPMVGGLLALAIGARHLPLSVSKN